MKKKAVKKKPEEERACDKIDFPHGFLFCADLGLRQPGFAILQLTNRGNVRVLATSVCDNRDCKGSHGEMLFNIAEHIKTFSRYIPKGARVEFVRERGFTKFNNATQVLYRVVGLTDYLLFNEFRNRGWLNWSEHHKTWWEIPAMSIKSIVAGDGRATKENVERSIQRFISKKVKFDTQDESDAVAAGIAWLIKSGFWDPDVEAPPEPIDRRSVYKG